MNMTHDIEIDATGLLCPLPVLKLRKRLLSIESGSIIKILADDPAAILDIPHFCNENNQSGDSMFSKIIEIKDKYTKWSLLIGPEGGFSEKEIVEIEKLNNCFSISLGNRILRSDTATTSALFCLQSIIESN